MKYGALKKKKALKAKKAKALVELKLKLAKGGLQEAEKLKEAAKGKGVLVLNELPKMGGYVGKKEKEFLKKSKSFATKL